MTVTELTALVIALGSAPILLKIIDWIKATRSGRAQEEKQRNRNALGRLVEAEQRADDEAEFRRDVQNFAARLERMLIQLGVPEDKMPEWPEMKARVKQ